MSLLHPKGLAGLAGTRFRMTFGHPHPLMGSPTVAGLRRFLFVESGCWPSVPFRFRLATDSLAQPSGSGQHGPQRTCTTKNRTIPGAQRSPRCATARRGLRFYRRRGRYQGPSGTSDILSWIVFMYATNFLVHSSFNSPKSFSNCDCLSVIETSSSSSRAAMSCIHLR